MGLLDGKRLLITGVITDASLAFHSAKIAQEQGAQVVLTGFGRMRLVERIAQRLPEAAPVVELDVSDQEQLDSLADRVSEHLGDSPRLDGVLHSIGFAPAGALGEGAFLNATWEDVAQTIQVSAYSFKSLAMACKPLLGPGSSIVGMDFDNRQAWPAYDWMGVAKSALESVTRYLARDLGPDGIRVNLVAAGPVRTMAAKSIPGFARFEGVWDERAPLGWDMNDPVPVAKTVCAVLSDWMPTTTGSMVMADGGVHAVGV
jgi:enoyl-[acyl-carrier protein] reductase I